MKIAGVSITGQRAGVSIVSSGILGVSHIKHLEITLPEEAGARSGALRDALIKWKKDHGIRGVVFGLEFRMFSLLTLELPLRSRSDVVRALPFELERHLPLSPDEYVFDAHVLKGTGEGTENLVMAVRAESLAWVGECLQGTGLKLLGVRCSFVEALNEFIKSGSGPRALYALSEGEYYSIAGLSGALRPEDLMSIKGNKAAAVELGRLKENYPGGVYVSGTNDMSAFEGMGAKPLAAISAPGAVASSVHGKKRTFEFDFTPPELVAQRKDPFPLAAGLLAAAAVILFFLTPVVSYYKDYSLLKSTEHRIGEIKETAHELLELKRGIDGVKRKKRFLTAFQEEKNLRVRVISELSAVLPGDAWLTHLSVDKNGIVELNGFAARAAGLIVPLEQSGLFRNVTFVNPVTTKDGRERFSLKMELDV